MMIKWTFLAVAAGFLIDLLIGDPRWLYHPIRLIGNLIAVLEKGLRRIFPDTRAGERTAGFFLVILVTAVSAIVPFAILYGAFYLNLWLGFAVEALMCYQILATRALRDESMKVYQALKTKDLDQSRKAVSMIVGREDRKSVV